MAQLRDIVAAISGLAGFEASEVDTSAIPDTDVRGYIIDRPQGAREVLAVLRSLYRFDVQDITRLHFVGRGRDGDTPFSLTEDTDTLTSAQRVRTQETELPRIVTLSYLDADRQLEFGSAAAQRSLVHRGLGAISSRQRFDLRAYIVLTPEQARGMAERMLYAYWRERDRMTINLPPRYLAISPGDFVSFLDRRNRRMLARVDRQDIGADLTTELEVTVVESVTEVTAVADSTSRLVVDVRIGEGLPSIDAPEPTPLIAPGRRTDIDGRLRMISVSALADGDVDVYGRTVRPYAVLERYEEASWDNASIRVSQARTGTQRTAIRGALAGQIIGRLIVPPSDDWTPDFIDRDGRMTVWVPDVTARVRLISLRPTSETEFVSERSRLVILRHDGEAAVLAYRFLEQSDADSQVLVISRLLRGLRGTEHLDRGYTGGETVVFLIPGERPAYVAINKVFRNRELFFQAHLEATPLGIIPHRLVPAALRPYSPAHLMVEGDAGDVTATWVRRTRMGGEDDFLDGIEDVPNVEPVERYDVDVLAEDGAVIHHVADVRATKYVYPLTQRQADEAGLEVEYRFEIGLDEDGRGGRQDVAETLLLPSRFSGNVLTMGRAGELLGVDWWASSGTQRTVRHAVFLMNPSTLLDVDSVLVEPSDPVTFDGRTGENFVSHDYAEPVPFAAGDTVLVAVEGGINVVPSGAMRDPRIRPPFNFAVQLDVATDDGVATTLGFGVLTMRLRYRMVISDHDARTVRVSQAGWAGLGTPIETTFTPDPLREPNRVRMALRLPSPDIIGQARATPLRIGTRLGTDRGQQNPTRATGERPWVLTGQVQATSIRLGTSLAPWREIGVGLNPFGPLGDPAITDSWRIARDVIFRGFVVAHIYELRPTAIKAVVEIASTAKAAVRVVEAKVLSGTVAPRRVSPRVHPRNVGHRLFYEGEFWIRGGEGTFAGEPSFVVSGSRAFSNESQPGYDLQGNQFPSGFPGLDVPFPTGTDSSRTKIPAVARDPGVTGPPLPSHWTNAHVLWMSVFSFSSEQRDVPETVIPPADPLLDPFGGTVIPWGSIGNQGAGTFDFTIANWPTGVETGPSIDDFPLLSQEFVLQRDVYLGWEVSLSYKGRTIRVQRNENYGLPDPDNRGVGRAWTIPPQDIAEMAKDLNADNGQTWVKATLRIEGRRSTRMGMGVRLLPAKFWRRILVGVRLRMPETRSSALRVALRLSRPQATAPAVPERLQTAVRLYISTRVASPAYESAYSPPVTSGLRQFPQWQFPREILEPNRPLFSDPLVLLPSRWFEYTTTGEEPQPGFSWMRFTAPLELEEETVNPSTNVVFSVRFQNGNRNDNGRPPGLTDFNWHPEVAGELEFAVRVDVSGLNRVFRFGLDTSLNGYGYSGFLSSREVQWVWTIEDEGLADWVNAFDPSQFRNARATLSILRRPT